MHERSTGFTLTELVITVAIIGLLATIAVPSYSSHVMRSHRNDAKTALLRLAAEQEKYYIQNNTYGTLAQLGDPTTEHGWYSLAITGADATTYTASATAKGDSPQVHDEQCQVFSIDAEGRRTALDADDADTTEHCWQ